jgi:hypothetical protein
MKSMKWKAITVTPQEAQIIEQKHVLVSKMCALVEYCTAQN